MAFTYDLDTSIGRLRLLLQDTDEDNLIFTDEEIQFFLSQNSSDLNMAASMGWLTIAGDKSRQAKIKRAGNYSHNLRQISQECRRQADYFKKLAYEEPAFEIVEFGGWGI